MLAASWILISLFCCASAAPIRDEPFAQYISDRYNFAGMSTAGWPTLPFGSVADAVFVPSLECVLMITNDTSPALFAFRNTTAERVNTGSTLAPASRMLLLKASDHGTAQVVVGAETGAQLLTCRRGGAITCTASAYASSQKWGDVTSMAEDGQGVVYFGTTVGLFTRDGVVSVVQEPVVDVVFNPTPPGFLFVGTGLRLYRRTNSSSGPWRFDWVGGIIDSNITALATDAKGRVWIGNAEGVTRTQQDPAASVPAWLFERMGGIAGDPGAFPEDAGLPMGNATCMAAGAGDQVWIGTTDGVVLYLGPRTWRYFNTARYIATSQPAAPVTHVAVDKRSGTAFVFTPFGMAVISKEMWTLERKAAYYQAMVYPRHNYLGMYLQCNLQKFGDLSTWAPPTVGESDGLWSSLYTAAQAFRFGATNDPAAREEAIKGFQANLFLEQVTGRYGFVARSYTKYEIPHNGGCGWHNSTTFPGWVYEGDTSSDSLTANVYAYPLFYDLVAQTPQEKALARSLINNVTGTIVDHGFYYMDWNGLEPTRWGQWAPSVLNDNPGWFDERGPNSMQILGYLLSAYQRTGNATFLTAAQNLRMNYGYAENIINARMTSYNDINYSDDELTFMSYYMYFTSTTDPDLLADLRSSATRSYAGLRDEHNPWFTFIAHVIGVDVSDADLSAAVDMLRRYPLELIDWPQSNSQRLDNLLNPIVSDPSQFLFALPPDERAMARWNANPYEVDDGEDFSGQRVGSGDGVLCAGRTPLKSAGGGSGFTEYEPTSWLLPYWMARYHGLLE